MRTETAIRCKNKMRYQLLVLVVCWLWTGTSSHSDDTSENHHQCTGDFQCDVIIYISQPLSIMCGCGESEEYIMVDCDIQPGNKTGNSGTCNVSTVISQCIEDNRAMTENSKGSTNNESPKSECVTSTEISEPELMTDGATKIDRLCTTNSPNSTIVVALGVLAALLLVLLVIVTAVLIWTCWLLKRRREMKYNYQLRSSTDHGQLVNPTYEGDDLLRLQQPGSVPAYKTIPPHPRDRVKLEFTEQGENGYHVLSREQRANPETITPTQHMETILRDSREESYSKLELREESGSTKKTSNEGIGEYNKLEMVNIGSNLPNDTCTADFNDNNKQTEGKKSVVDDKVFDDNGDVLQLETGDVEKEQEEQANGKLPLITITLDVQNERNDSGNPETSTTDSTCV